MFEIHAASHEQLPQQQEEENYFVSMTDMLVGMLFLFVIMLMAFAINYKQAQDTSDDQRKDINETIKKISEEVQIMREEVRGMSEADNQRRILLRQLKKRLQSVGVNVKIDEANGVLRLPDDTLNFPSNSAELPERGKRALGHVARALEAILPCYAKRSPSADFSFCPAEQEFALEAIFIEGHTDTDGTAERNWRLSAQRAIETYRALEEAAPSVPELKNNADQRLLSVSGYAYYRGIAPNDTEENKKQNRRIDLRFIMQISHQRSLLRIQESLQGIIDRLQGTIRK